MYPQEYMQGEFCEVHKKQQRCVAGGWVSPSAGTPAKPASPAVPPPTSSTSSPKPNTLPPPPLASPLAGLKRLGLLDKVAQVFELDEMLPAACQGTIGVTCRTTDQGMIW